MFRHSRGINPLDYLDKYLAFASLVYQIGISNITLNIFGLHIVLSIAHTILLISTDIQLNLN